MSNYLLQQMFQLKNAITCGQVSIKNFYYLRNYRKTPAGWLGHFFLLTLYKDINMLRSFDNDFGQITSRPSEKWYGQRKFIPLIRLL
jgi:hypothetical protein